MLDFEQLVNAAAPQDVDFSVMKGFVGKVQAAGSYADLPEELEYEAECTAATLTKTRDGSKDLLKTEWTILWPREFAGRRVKDNLTFEKPARWKSLITATNTIQKIEVDGETEEQYAGDGPSGLLYRVTRFKIRNEEFPEGSGKRFPKIAFAFHQPVEFADRNEPLG